MIQRVSAEGPKARPALTTTSTSLRLQPERPATITHEERPTDRRQQRAAERAETTTTTPERGFQKNDNYTEARTATPARGSSIR